MTRGSPTHPKIYDLVERLGICRTHAVRILDRLFHFVARMPESDAGRFSDKRIAVGRRLEWRNGQDVSPW
jgi:hypothetical protein